MKILSSRKHHYIEGFSILLIVLTFIVGMVSCAGGNGVGNGDGEDGLNEETPQYGGILVTVSTEDPVGYDDAIVPHYQTTGSYQCLWGGDWAKGNAGGYGTGECDWYIRGAVNRLEHKTHKIAESWEIGEDYIIFHLREGVLWHDKFPCNGREVTADDVVFSLERHRTLDTAYIKQNYPSLAAAMSISKVDEGTVRIDCSPQQMYQLIYMIDFMYIYPQDAIESYGDMNDWERAIGTGAFTLEEYVEGSYLYYERNPDYWEANPVGPGQGDQLPYLDGVKTLIIPDTDKATVDGLFATGQLAVVTAVTADYDRVRALKTLPSVEYAKFLDGFGKCVIYMRTDKEDKPYSDVQVRQALMLAIDHQKIVDDLYGGEGEILYWPIYYCREYAGAYLPLEDLDDDTIEDIVPSETISVADLFGYDPVLAQQLLAEAGYSNGFQAEIVVYDNYLYLDVITMVKDMWAEIGVDLTIKALDYDTWIGRQFFRSYDDMLYGVVAGISTYFREVSWSDTGVLNNMFNASYINDPVLGDYRERMRVAYPDEDECDSIHQEMLPYLLEQCYVLQTAGPYTYRFWWPWLKNYSGEGVVGFYAGIETWTPYVWIDQELKEEMGHIE